MFNIKKILSFSLVLSLLISMVGCKGKDNGQTPEGSNPNPTPTPVIEQREYNYLTGRPFKDGQDKTARPVAVMINNAKLALPQSGLETADIIYEMVTEGGITRLMALYSDIEAMGMVGPVRSARDQFVEFLLPLNAIYVHIGTSIYAKEMLNFYSYQDIDGIYLGTTSFDFDVERNKDRGSEHCWYTKPNLVRDGIAATGIATTGNLYPAFNFANHKEPAVLLENGQDATEIYFRFSDYADASMTYNPADGRYYKNSLGAPQIDAQTGTQVSFDNFILLTTDISLYPDGLCTKFDLTEGSGYYFYGGKYIPITWEKGRPENPLQIFDKKGEPIEINVGKSYVAVLGNDMVPTLTMNGANQQVTPPAVTPAPTPTPPPVVPEVPPVEAPPVVPEVTPAPAAVPAP